MEPHFEQHRPHFACPSIRAPRSWWSEAQHTLDVRSPQRMTYPSMTQHWIVQPDDPSMSPVYRSPARPPLGGQPKAPQGPRLRAQEPLGLHGTQALVPRADRLLVV